MSWPEVLTHWADIEADLQDAGVDVASGVLRHRDSRWLRTRITGLLNADSRLARRLNLLVPLHYRHLPFGGGS